MTLTPDQREALRQRVMAEMSRRMPIISKRFNDWRDWPGTWAFADVAVAALQDELARGVAVAPATDSEPLDMVLHCPKCHTQHVDEPDERTPGWVNPPHRSHLCHACGAIWRPADVPTNGVRGVKTRGKADTWPDGVGIPQIPKEN